MKHIKRFFGGLSLMLSFGAVIGAIFYAGYLWQGPLVLVKTVIALCLAFSAYCIGGLLDECGWL